MTQYWAVVEGPKTVWGLGRTKKSAIKDATEQGLRLTNFAFKVALENPHTNFRVSRCTRRLFDYVEENNGDLRRRGTVIQLGNGFFDLKLRKDKHK